MKIDLITSQLIILESNSNLNSSDKKEIEKIREDFDSNIEGILKTQIDFFQIKAKSQGLNKYEVTKLKEYRHTLENIQTKKGQQQVLAYCPKSSKNTVN